MAAPPWTFTTGSLLASASILSPAVHRLLADGEDVGPTADTRTVAVVASAPYDVLSLSYHAVGPVGRTGLWGIPSCPVGDRLNPREPSERLDPSR
jgi:hypothetical protein